MFSENEFSVIGKSVVYILLAMISASCLLNIYRGIVPHPFEFSLVFLGLILFLFAKLSILSKGIWLSFGTKMMTPLMANIYRTGYWVMIVGVLLTFG